MLFLLKNTSDNYNSIKLNNQSIEKVTSFKLLGIYIDDKLSFKDHVSSLTIKISKPIGIIKTLSFLPDYILKTLYFSLIYPHFYMALMSGISQ